MNQQTIKLDYIKNILTIQSNYNENDLIIINKKIESLFKLINKIEKQNNKIQ